MKRLSSLKPHLFTAYYNWLLENEITPHLLVDASVKGVRVPLDYVKNGCIILSMLPSAIAEFKCLNTGISFKARFRGVSEDIYVPYAAMDQLIALETGAALPIGKALEQLDLGDPDGEIYPDQGLPEEPSLFSLDDGEDDSADESESDGSQSFNPSFEDSASEVTKSDTQSKPGFEFVKE